MKKICAILFVLLFAGVAFASAQVIPLLKFELGTSVSYYNLKFDNDGGSLQYLNIPVRFGWYVLGGLELEPEVQVFIPMGDSGGETTYFFQGHVLYNFSLAGKIVPFIGAGAGVGNGLPVYGIIEGASDTNSFAYLGMAGVKLMIGNSAAIRIEYRFNRFSWETSDTLEKEWGNLSNILVGISVFF
jgi:hypothetical protein